jgi:aromatic-L-amino-acid decarboxylase
MDSEQFRREAHAAVDWMADYLRDVEKLRVTPEVQPGDIKRCLPSSPPEEPEPFERIFRDFERVIVPGMTHWNHPGFFAYFPANHSPPSILGEMLTATLGAQCMSWQTSPAATELEQVVTDWLRQLIGLPPAFRGVIQDTASSATLVALLCARERATQHAYGRRGAAAALASRLTVYASQEAHSSVVKAAKLAGFGTEHLRLIDVDDSFALDPVALGQALEQDRAAGSVPACIVATVGTTSSSALDPLEAVADLAARYGAWLHVDAAYGGSAAILPERRSILQGVERAHSLVFNPHKWLFTNFDCSAYFTREPQTLLATFQTSPEYLKTPHDAEVANFRDWGIQLGRRFRALKLWFVLRAYGAEGLRARLREHLRLAQLFRGWVASDPNFELAAPAPLALVCFRYTPRGSALTGEALDALNERLLKGINASGRVYLTHTRLGGRFTLRLSVGQLQTQEHHVRLAWDIVKEAQARLTRTE